MSNVKEIKKILEDKCRFVGGSNGVEVYTSKNGVEAALKYNWGYTISFDVIVVNKNSLITISKDTITSNERLSGINSVSILYEV